MTEEEQTITDYISIIHSENIQEILASMDALINKIDTLSVSERKQIIDAFCTKLDSSNQAERNKAIGFLLSEEEPKIEEKIVNLLFHEQKNFRNQTANILKQKKWIPKKKKDQAQFYALTSNWIDLKKLGIHALDALLFYLKNNDIRKEILELLLKIEDTAIYPLTALLEDSDETIRKRVYNVLSKCKNLDHLAYLERAMEDSSRHVRTTALGSYFIEITNDKLLPRILEIYDQEEEDNKPYLIRVLAKYQDPKTFKIVLEAAMSKENKFRNAAAIVLPNFVDHIDTDTLFELYQSKNIPIKEIALKQLAKEPNKKIIDIATNLLKKSRECSIRCVAAQILRSSKEEKSVQALIKTIKFDLDNKVVNEALNALAYSESQQAIDFVIDYFNKYPERIRHNALALWEYSKRNLLSKEFLEKIYKTIDSNPDYLYNNPPLADLVLTNEELETKIINYYKQRLEKSDEFSRNRVANIFINLRKEECLPFLLKFIEKEKSSVVIENIVNSVTNLKLENMVDFFVDILYLDVYPASKVVAGHLVALDWKPKDEDEEIFFLILKQDLNALVEKGGKAFDILVEYLEKTVLDHSRIKHFIPLVALQEIDEERAIKSLVKILLNKDKKTHLRTLEKTASILTKELNWEPKTVEEKVAVYLYTCNFEELKKYENEAIEKIHSLILDNIYNHNDWKVIAFLGKINRKESIPYIFKLVEKNPYVVGSLIIETLEQMGWKPKTEEEKIYLHIMKNEWSSLLKYKKKVLPHLLNHLLKEQYLSPVKMVDDYFNVLINNKEQLKPLLKKGLKNDDSAVRTNCLNVLGVIGDFESLNIILDHAKTDIYDPDEGDGRIYTNYLVRKSTPEMIPDLLKVLRDTKVHLDLREIIGNIIQNHDHSWDARDSRFYYLVKQPVDPRRIKECGKHIIKPLMKAKNQYSGESQYNIVKGLGMIGGKEVIEPLLEYLSADYSVTSALAAKTLGDIGDTGVIEALEYASLSASKETRNGIQEALYKLKGPISIQTFYDILKYEAFYDINEDELKQFYIETSEASILGIMKVKITTETAFIFKRLAKLADYCQLRENKGMSLHYLNKLLDSRKDVFLKSNDKINKEEISSILKEISCEDTPRRNLRFGLFEKNPIKELISEILTKLDK